MSNTSRPLRVMIHKRLLWSACMPIKTRDETGFSGTYCMKKPSSNTARPAPLVVTHIRFNRSHHKSITSLAGSEFRLDVSFKNRSKLFSPNLVVTGHSYKPAAVATHIFPVLSFSTVLVKLLPIGLERLLSLTYWFMVKSFKW